MTLTDEYATRVHPIESPSVRAALDAVAAVDTAKAALAEALARRDAALVLVAEETGWSVPRLGRLLGMSSSNVRVILDRAKWMAQGRDTAD